MKHLLIRIMHDVAHVPVLWFPQLQELEAEDLDSQLLEPAPVPATRVPARAQAQPAAAAGQRMPNVPAARPKQKTAEELELEALEAEMAA